MKQDFSTRTEELRQRISKHIASYIETELPTSLYDPIRYAMQSGGKRIRPALALTCSGAVGGKIEDALDVAAALELAHNFTLVHDDIMDNDELRRGRETVYKKWDANVGILAGDALLVKAYEALGNAPVDHLPRLLSEFNYGILAVCEGQALDIEFEERDDVTLDEYFEMIHKKTGCLFSLSCSMGGIVGNGNDEQIAALSNFGAKLGRAFQLQDDLLDILSDEKTFGKDIGSDFKEDKKTFLMLYIKEHADEQNLRDLEQLRQSGHLDQDAIQRVKSIMEKVGAIDAAKGLVAQALEEAEASLDTLPKNEYSDLLKELLHILEHRTY